MRNSGFLLIDKPKGITSHDVVEIIRRKSDIRKVGHSGTLDPFATGLLIIGVGKATRLLEYLQKEKKTYYVRAKLGIITDTFDITGKIQEEREVESSDIDKLKGVILSFLGEYEQIPPAYSSKRYKGERLYNLARKGKIINLPPKKVYIYSIENIQIFENHIFSFICEVSSGTYIRSLIMDIGYKLGTGAVTMELRRLKIDDISVNDAKNIENIAIPDDLIKPTKILKKLPKVVLNKNAVKDVLNGKHIFMNMVEKVVGDFNKKDKVMIVDSEDNLIAIAVAERKRSFLNTLKKLNRNERIFTLEKVLGGI